MTIFRPCIDLHKGRVKQIIGSSLTFNENELAVNFESDHPSSYYANIFRENNLVGGHIIMLGPGNQNAASEALNAWPNAFQIGGGINEQNALYWLDDMAAGKIIVTSAIFPEKRFCKEILRRLSEKVDRSRLVIDLSCKRFNHEYIVVMNRWMDKTDQILSENFISLIEEYSSEILVHAADVEGTGKGIDKQLVKLLSKHTTVPCTYAGGGRTIADMEIVHELSGGKLDITFGSCLDIYGGDTITLRECIGWNNANKVEM